MVTEQNMQIIRQLYTAVTALKQRAVHYRSSGNGTTQYTVSAKPSNLKAFNQFFTAVNDAFPDFELTLNSLIVKGDRVMARYTISGTHKKDFLGIAPTNERMSITGIDVFRLSNGKVAEHWDAAHQISALPKSDQTPVSPARSNWIKSFSGKLLSLST